MKLAPVRVGRASEVYAACAERQPKPDALRRVCKIASYVLSPRVTYTEGAEKALTERVEEKDPLLIAFNHPSKFVDPFIVAGGALDTPIEPRLDETYTLGKDSIFRLFPGLMTDMGGIPVFRELDHGTASLASMRGLMRVCKKRLVERGNIVIFPGGKHNDGDPTVVEDIEPGFQLMARQALSAGVSPYIVPAAIYKGPRNRAQSASLVFGTPMAVADLPRKRDDFLEQVHEGMQDALNLAIDRY